MTSTNTFDTLGLRPELATSLASIGYTDMTLVQEATLPKTLAGADVLARARTGSGKTAAFGLGILDKLDAASFRVQAFVLCPTRELADQVAREIRRLAKGIGNVKVKSLCGGVPIGPQIASLAHSPHVIVGTPGRVLDHLRRGTVRLETVRTFVLDEADRMLDMGFTDELDAIIEFLPAKRQTLLFSATYPDGIATMSARVQRNPVIVDVTNDEGQVEVAQYWCRVTREDRLDGLLRALYAWGGALNLVFCNTRQDCADVADFLRAKDIVALALHGDLDQAERTEVLVRFANRSACVLVATDVAARGLDVDDLDLVVNYELPKQADVYVHRIGRTARAGKSGLAVSLIEQTDEWRLQAIEALPQGAALESRTIPEVSPSAGRPTPSMQTLQVSGGRKNKLRPGDLLGALTASGGIPGSSVGTIDLFDTVSYVAVAKKDAQTALRQLSSRPIKGRKYRVRIRR